MARCSFLIHVLYFLVSLASAAPGTQDERELFSRRLFDLRGGQPITQARTASCVFDALHAATYIAQAGTSIDAATRKCHGPTQDAGANSALCSVSVSQIIESFSYAASFLSIIAVDCTDESNFRADCAASITGLIGALGDFAQAGSGMSYDCPGTKNHPGRRLNETEAFGHDASTTVTAAENVEVVDRHQDEKRNESFSMEEKQQRRLWSPIQNPVWTRYPGGNSEVAVRNHKAESAFCGIYSAQATFFLARAGLNINEAVHTCPKATTGVQKAVCGGDVSVILLSLVNVASFISGAVAQCEHGLNAPAACAADITKLIAAMGVVSAAAQGIFVSCVNKNYDYYDYYWAYQ